MEKRRKRGRDVRRRTSGEGGKGGEKRMRGEKEEETETERGGEEEGRRKSRRHSLHSFMCRFHHFQDKTYKIF